MLTMNRYLDVSKLQTRLGYAPLDAFEGAWQQGVKAVRAQMVADGELEDYTRLSSPSCSTKLAPAYSRKDVEAGLPAAANLRRR